MPAFTEEPMAHALILADEEEDVEAAPAHLYELGTRYSSVMEVPGPPPVPQLGRAPRVAPLPAPTDEELARRGWSIPLALASPSMLVGARTSRRPTVRAPHARASLQPTIPPHYLP